MFKMAVFGILAKQPGQLRGFIPSCLCLILCWLLFNWCAFGCRRDRSAVARRVAQRACDFTLMFTIPQITGMVLWFLAPLVSRRAHLIAWGLDQALFRSLFYLQGCFMAFAPLYW